MTAAVRLAASVIRSNQSHRQHNPPLDVEGEMWTPFSPIEIERELRPFMYQQARPGDPGPMFDDHFERDGFR